MIRQTCDRGPEQTTHRNCEKKTVAVRLRDDVSAATVHEITTEVFQDADLAAEAPLAANAWSTHHVVVTIVKDSGFRDSIGAEAAIVAVMTGDGDLYQCLSVSP